MESCDELSESIVCLRTIAERYSSARQHSTAVFWYEQLISVIEKDDKLNTPHCDYMKYLDSLMACNYHYRVVSFITNRQLSSTHIVYRLLIAQALLKTGDHEKVLKVLAECRTGDDDGGSVSNCIPFWMNLPIPSQVLGSQNRNRKLSPDSEQFLDALSEQLLAPSSLLLLIGKTYLALDNRIQAVACLKECLKKDPFCFEALETLLSGHLLGWKEKKALLQQTSQDPPNTAYDYLQFTQENDLKSKITKQLYAAILGQSGHLKSYLKHSLLMRTCDAEFLSEKAEYRRAFAVSSEVLKEEEFYWPCVPVHINLLLELNKLPKLFLLAHRLVDCFPDNALSWFAVGSYYYANGQFEAAKKFLAKCTSMKKPYGAGWLLFGHAFAMEREHDQAMNCYFKVFRKVFRI